MLKISQLVYFCAVVEHGTIAAASRVCHCVPANITIRLKELESQLGVRLFDREKSRLYVTPEGRLLYDKARHLIALHRETLELFSVEGIKGVLNIGALDAALTNQLPEVIAASREAMRNVVFNIRVGHSFDLEHALLNGDLDVIISDGPVEHPLMESELAFEERLVLITPERIDEPSSDNLADKELYVFGQNCFYRAQVDAWIKARKITPRLLMEVESYPVMIRCVTQGMGFAFVPESFLDTLSLHEGLRVHRDIIDGNSDLYFIKRKDAASEVIDRFRQLVLQAQPRSRIA